MYTVTNLLDDIKLIYQRAGMEGKGIVFQFNDTNVKDEIFLDHINNILMGGMVSWVNLTKSKQLKSDPTNHPLLQVI